MATPTGSSPSTAAAILDALRRVLPTEGHLGVHEPVFQGKEWEYVKECLDTRWVSSAGKFVERFEANLADYTGARFAIAVMNGTAALHVALQLAGVRPGDEVLVPALTFVATANAVSYCGAVPHFVDSDERTLGVDPVALRAHLAATCEIARGECVNRASGRPVRVLIPMHTFGHPADLNGLIELAHDFHLTVVEDATESLGSFYHGRHTGTFGQSGALSFNGNKVVTTGGGGAILTDDPALGRSARHLTTTAKVPHRWNYFHDQIGYNHRMPNLNAALGCAQLEQLPTFLASKRRLFERYERAFAGVPFVKLVAEPDGCRSNYWLQTLLIDGAVADERDSIISEINHAGLGARPAWTLMCKLPMYRSCPSAPLPVAVDLEKRVINIPSSAELA